MGKITTNKLQKKNALLQTAFELFTDKGFAKTTISDIVNQAGLAKGTFYLYFKDKYDLKDKLIIHQAGQLLGKAHRALEKKSSLSFEDTILYFADYIICYFEQNPGLLQFLSKNLSWGIFKTAFEQNVPEESRQFYDYYLHLMEEKNILCPEPELMLFTLIEFVGSTCHSCLLYRQPVSMEEYLPYLHEMIRHILMIYISHSA
ncbi:MAG: TetR/AcrR family transcriptional regulator [Eubacteriales bacterium]|nr:TetR/AcrR family transcriptional regulator [Eubacteriales bacterium]